MRLKRTMFLIQTPIVTVMNGRPTYVALTVGIAVTERQADELCTAYQDTTGRSAAWVEVPIGTILDTEPKKEEPT